MQPPQKSPSLFLPPQPDAHRCVLPFLSSLDRWSVPALQLFGVCTGHAGLATQVSAFVDIFIPPPPCVTSLLRFECWGMHTPPSETRFQPSLSLATGVRVHSGILCIPNSAPSFFLTTKIVSLQIRNISHLPFCLNTFSIPSLEQKIPNIAGLFSSPLLASSPQVLFNYKKSSGCFVLSQSGKKSDKQHWGVSNLTPSGN